MSVERGRRLNLGPPVALGVLLGLAAPAMASPPFPFVVQSHFSLPAPVPQSCALCHTNGITGLGTVNTPFGRAVRARGAVALLEPVLETALDRLQADLVDSDLDGLTDVTELAGGTDPNEAEVDGGAGGGEGGGGGGGGGGGAVLPPPLVYGCGASAAPMGERGGGLLGAVLFAALRLRARRTRSLRHQAKLPRRLRPQFAVLAFKLLDAFNIARIALSHGARRSGGVRRCPTVPPTQLIEPITGADRCAIHVRKRSR